MYHVRIDRMLKQQKSDEAARVCLAREVKGGDAITGVASVWVSAVLLD